MIKKINLRGNPVLRTATVLCVPVVLTPAGGGLTGALEVKNKEERIPWLPEVIELVTDLLDTAEALGSECLGLAANQIWDKDTPCPSVFVMRWPSNEGIIWRPLINPVIKTTGRTLKLDESCLSIPNVEMRKSRGQNVILVFQTLDNEQYQVTKLFHKHGVFAQIAQHEYDHLQGKLIKK